MKTIVTTQQPVAVDRDAPPVSSVEFADAKMLVDKDTGALHVHNHEGTIASFNELVWASAVRGTYRVDNGRAVRA